jgi:hypothetical protein
MLASRCMMTEIAMIDRRALLAAGALLALLPARAAPAALKIKVYKDPSCGCCTAWADKLTAAGFDVEVEAHDDMDALKSKLGVPSDLVSCHTGVINGYAIEGHVPPADVKRLVTTKARGKGLAVPGMPINSPGMEVPGEADEPYTVWLFQKDQTRTAFARHGG